MSRDMLDPETAQVARLIGIGKSILAASYDWPQSKDGDGYEERRQNIKQHFDNHLRTMRQLVNSFVFSPHEVERI